MGNCPKHPKKKSIFLSTPKKNSLTTPNSKNSQTTPKTHLGVVLEFQRANLQINFQNTPKIGFTTVSAANIFPKHPKNSVSNCVTWKLIH